MKETVTTEEWLAELERVSQTSAEGYLTMRQMSEHTRRRLRWIRDRLGQLKGEGRLAVRDIQETNIAGKPCWVPAYRILPRKAKEAGDE
jgi:hypothetical protein